jgi:hypothetical protein
MYCKFLLICLQWHFSSLPGNVSLLLYIISYIYKEEAADYQVLAKLNKEAFKAITLNYKPLLGEIKQLNLMWRLLQTIGLYFWEQLTDGREWQTFYINQTTWWFVGKVTIMFGGW